MNPLLELSNIRNVLIRQEETIIFALVERAQFKVNDIIYQPGGLSLQKFEGSFVDYLLQGTEELHAKVRRYTSPDEHSFSKNLPEPILPALDFDSPIKETGYDINDKIHQMYFENIIPAICEEGDDEQYGSSAINDVVCLQAISKRIHYGMFVAESKYISEVEKYRVAIEAKDCQKLMEMITNAEVEAKLLQRVEKKAATYGQEIDALAPTYKICPKFVVDLYKKCIIPLTKEVEVEYLLRR